MKGTSSNTVNIRIVYRDISDSEATRKKKNAQNPKVAEFCFFNCGKINFKMMTRDLDSYYLNKEEPNRSCLLALRSIIFEQDTNVTETQKWGMPCFCYKKKMFCYLWTDKKTDNPYILMVEGKYLHRPELESGSRSRMKIFRINPNEDLPYEAIKLLLNEALDLYRNGTIKIK